MADRRGSRLDFFAWGLLVVGLLLAVCVFSHDPGAAGAYPQAPPANLLGPAGAWLARALWDTLGNAVHVLLASWFVLVLMLLLRRRMLTWSLRLAGWLLLLPCAAVAADWAGPDLVGGPLAGSGGSLGAWLATGLEDH